MSQELLASMTRIAQADPQALADLYDRTSRMVFSLALRILGREDEAEEVALDVYAQVWRTAASYDPRRGPVEAWLSTIARSRAVDRRRARTARPDLAGVPGEVLDVADLAGMTDPDECVSVLDARWRVDAMMSGLAPEDRRLIDLAFFQGCTHTELAALLHLPLGTVKTRIRRALGQMRNTLTALEHDPDYVGSRL